MNSWHQHSSAAFANEVAHIRADDWIRSGLALCGASKFNVYIEAKHRNNPNNKPCKKCKAIADKREADAEQWRKASTAERAAILGL